VPTVAIFSPKVDGLLSISFASGCARRPTRRRGTRPSTVGTIGTRHGGTTSEDFQNQSSLLKLVGRSRGPSRATGAATRLPPPHHLVRPQPRGGDANRRNVPTAASRVLNSKPKLKKDNKTQILENRPPLCYLSCWHI